MDNVTTGADRTAGRSGIASLRSPPLLVGRSREQDVLRAELAAARGGHGRLVLLGGEAGIGKTTLARDLSRDADALGCPRPGRVLLRPDQYPALRPVARPVRGMPARSGPARASRRLRRRPAGAGHRPGRALRRGAAIPGRAHRRPVRPSSSSRISTGPTRPASTSCATSVPTCGTGRSCCSSTYRVDELTPGHPFAQQLPALVREAEGQRLDLRRLDQDALRALVAARYRLARAGRGSPRRLPGAARRGQPLLRHRTPAHVGGGSAAAPRRGRLGTRRRSTASWCRPCSAR